ncbi:MAG: DUF1697 domain-containing protein [Propylenella sp.]
MFVAFLRGINVVGKKVISMARLRTLFDALDFENARTHLNSGNVIFASDEKDRAKFADRIGEAVEKEFGFRPAIMIRDAAAIRRILKRNPFREMAESDPSHLFVTMLAAKPGKGAAKRLADAYQGPEEFRISGEEAYITYPNGVGKSKLTNALLEKHLGVAGTARNWNTVAKLLGMAEGK